MKTFLQHCKGVCREAGLAGGETAITTTIAQRGQVERIINYVIQSWTEIQSLHQSANLNWRWMHSQFELTTVASQDQYSYDDAALTDEISTAAIDRWRNWNIKDWDNPPTAYLTSAGEGTEGFLTYIEWKQFKYIYRTGTQPEGYPAHITINPQNQIVLGPIPDDIYTIKGDYQKGVQLFALDGDVPELPEAFEDVIMFKALTKYGLHANAPERVVAGEDGYHTYLGYLEADQLAEIEIGEPLA
jgi:hypothetical protein